MRTPILAVPVQLPLEWNTYLLLNFDFVNFVGKTNEREEECVAIFFSLAVSQSSVGEGLSGGTESLIQGQLKSHLFPAGI